jgi:hypothetical protein
MHNSAAVPYSVVLLCEPQQRGQPPEQQLHASAGGWLCNNAGRSVLLLLLLSCHL